MLIAELRSNFCFFPAAAALALLALAPQAGRAQSGGGAVYVLTNQVSGNSVMVYHRDAKGALTFVNTFATGGKGAGSGADPLGSQGSLVLSEDERLLFAVNAGSNSVSVFAVSGDQLQLLNTAASGGVMPVSMAVKHDVVYVVNAGGTPNISGFVINPFNNSLVPLPGSSQNLPGGASASPAQISFTPDGGLLMVTEKGTSLIDTFVLHLGIAQPGTSFPSNGTEPFGFAFGLDNEAVVSDVAGGPGGTSALTSYDVAETGNLTVITPAIGDTEEATCWVVVTQNGKFAYTANAGSSTISSYTVSPDGNLTLLNPAAAAFAGGGVPLDMALSTLGRFLFVRVFNSGTIASFRVEADGSLTPLGVASGVPAGSQGIAAR
jgi:6-phosphogluconolactonase